MTVLGLPVQPREPYLTRGELARELRCSPKTVDRWRREGMPSEVWGPGHGSRRFQLSLCLAWLRGDGRRAA